MGRLTAKEPKEPKVQGRAGGKKHGENGDLMLYLLNHVQITVIHISFLVVGFSPPL